ncbi:MAG: DsrE family protein [Candidatus Sedimenticola sp. 6PFRAG7]
MEQNPVPRHWQKMLAITLSLVLLLPMLAQADQVEQILALPEPPDGIVFEVVSGDGDALEQLMPSLNRNIQRLRKRFPALDIAVVSHGAEQFALQSDAAEEFQEVHELVQSLGESDVPVHVCGTHASWRDKTIEDFPDYVDVSPSGPAQINQYIDRGYIHILVD